MVQLLLDTRQLYTSLRGCWPVPLTAPTVPARPSDNSDNNESWCVFCWTLELMPQRKMSMATWKKTMDAKKNEKTIKSRLEELYNAVMQASKGGDSSAFGQVQLVWGTSDMLGCFKGLFAFVFIHKLWCSLYIQLRRYPSALQRSHWRCLGFLLAVAKRGWSENGSSYQQCLRGGRVEQHQWLNSSTANSCKDSSSDVAFEATDQTLHDTRPIARLKKLQHKPDPIILVSCSALSSLIFWLPKRRNNLAHTLGKNPFLNRLSRHLSSFCLGWGWGTPSSLWRWWRFAEWFLAALSYSEINTLLVVCTTAIAENTQEWRLYKKSEIHKDRFFPPVSIAQSIQPVLHLCLISDWLNMNYLTRQTRHVMLVGPKAWSNGPGCLWEVAGANGNGGNEGMMQWEWMPPNTDR